MCKTNYDDVALSKIGIDFLPILYGFKNKRLEY